MFAPDTLTAVSAILAIVERARRDNAAKREEAPCATRNTPSLSPERSAA